MASINLGVQNLPKVAKDTSDRNRTSPLAFTGNKFEFRAVGSTHNVSEPATIFNMLAAYGFKEITDRITKLSGDAKSNAIKVLKDVLKETKHVRFEGDNYSEKWHKEAAKRGLPNTKNTPAALEQFLTKDITKFFEGMGILTARELDAKIEIKLEAYNNVKDIEYKTAVNMAKTIISPAVRAHLTDVATAASTAASAGVKSAALFADLKVVDGIYTDIQTGIADLEKILVKIEKIDDLHKQAHGYADEAALALAKLRSAVDSAEVIVADDLWPLAKYQELLLQL
jgi:glutamine synthetase